jgi:hypothetical protein
MSDTIAIRVVCEGPTDMVVIRSVVAALGIDAVITQIQPEDNSNLLGDFGGGWKGVRAWCQDAVTQGGLQVTLANAQALIVHVDADIAYDKELACAQPCPPAQDTANAVRSMVLEWLGVTSPPQGVVLCVPAMATEAWAFCALFPMAKEASAIECRREPAALLVPKKPKLVAKKGKRYVKDPLAYEEVLEAFIAGWKGPIPQLCGEGARFLNELHTAIT